MEIGRVSEGLRIKLRLEFVVLFYRESLGSLDIQSLQNVNVIHSIFMLVSW